MSAFLVDNLHVNVLAAYAVAHDLPSRPAWDARAGLRGVTADALAMLLWQENARSIVARYGDLPDLSGFRYYVPNRPFDAWAILKASHCLDYQSCEHDGWMGSDAKRANDLIAANALRSLGDPSPQAIANDRRYHSAEWEITADTVTA